MPRSPKFFDAHLHADGLSDQDLRSMALFGLEGALVPARDVVHATTKDLLAHFEGLIHRQSRRLSKLGIRAYAALGVHPARIPWHGLEEALASIPRLATAGRLVAIGEIGLDRGGAREEQVFEQQLELARELHLPVMIHSPEREKHRVTRRALSLLRISGIEAWNVLVGHCDERTLRLVRECGYFAGLSVSPGRLRAEEAVRLIRAHGSEALMVSSESGDGVNDIMALPRVASLMSGQGLGAALVRRVLCDNALGFLRLSREDLEGRSRSKVGG